MNKPMKIFLTLLNVLILFSCTKQETPNKKPDPPKVEDSLDKELSEAPPEHTQLKLFDGGAEGYHSYRIPSLIRTSTGTLIAFAEGRKNDNRDFGDIDLVFKTSKDNGATWSALKVIVSEGDGTWGNPTAVVDESNRKVWLFMSWNSATHNQSGTDGFERIDSWGDRKVFVSYSDDEGNSWSTPKDLTGTLLPQGYTWDAMGPGIGIQKVHAGNIGRLIIPAIGRNIYSDDHGETWQYQLLASGTSEGTIIEKVNGSLIRNDRAVRSQWELSKRRRISTGTALSFSGWASDETLLDPANQASILRFTDDRNRILFLNSASTSTRGIMLLRISYDEGRTWPIDRRVYDNLTEQQAISQGKGGYSSMIKTKDNMVGALIEINKNTRSSATSNRSIDFHKLNLTWILNGSNEP